MLSGVTLRAQIASIIDALSKAAVAEISKAVDDSVVVLRLEICQRENEIKNLKTKIEVLHNELKAAQGAEDRVPIRPETHGRDDGKSGFCDERSLLDNMHIDIDQNSLSTTDVQVKSEPGEGASENGRGRPDQMVEELSVYKREREQWTLRSHSDTEPGNPSYVGLEQSSLSCLPEAPMNAGLATSCGGSGALQQSPFTRGPLGCSPYRSSYNTARRRTTKRLMFKKGFICPYCGKSFERSGHLERHKLIHTGEKPFHCEICGKRFNQKCSLKGHTKTHQNCIQKTAFEMQAVEQRQAPDSGNLCVDDTQHQPEDEKSNEVENHLLKNEETLPTPIQVKSEPTEEDAAQPLYQGGNEQTREGLENLDITAFERDSLHWMSGLHGQNNPDMRSIEYLSSSGTNSAPFARVTPLLPPMAEASCSSFPFARKPYGDLQDEMISQQQYGSSDTLLISSDGTVHSSLHGMAGPSLNHQQPRRSGYFQVVKPKKSFVCSYCSKVFERVGHLERHLRIHTGEKPYGCHICGRCFNQKSSLKGHMKTHINGESKALLEAHHLVYKMHEEQQSANPIVCKTELPTLEEQRPGSGYSERGIEQVLIVKVEPEGEGFRTLNQSVDEHGTGTLDQNQLWTLEMETSDDTASPIPGCSNASTSAADGVSRSVEYHLSPVCREETHHLAKERLS